VHNQSGRKHKDPPRSGAGTTRSLKLGSSNTSSGSESHGSNDSILLGETHADISYNVDQSHIGKRSMHAQNNNNNNNNNNDNRSSNTTAKHSEVEVLSQSLHSMTISSNKNNNNMNKSQRASRSRDNLLNGNHNQSQKTIVSPSLSVNKGDTQGGRHKAQNARYNTQSSRHDARGNRNEKQAFKRRKQYEKKASPSSSENSFCSPNCTLPKILIDLDYNLNSEEECVVECSPSCSWGDPRDPGVIPPTYLFHDGNQTDQDDSSETEAEGDKPQEEEVSISV